MRRGVNAQPGSTSPEPYTLFRYDANGRPYQRERRYAQNGPLQVLDFTWDGDDRLRAVRQGGSLRFEARYNSEGLRVYKSDFWTGAHDYTWGLEGVLHDSAQNTSYAPGIGQQQNGVTQYFHPDWLGSTRYMTDANSVGTSLRRYDAFGQLGYYQGTIYNAPRNLDRGISYKAVSEHGEQNDHGDTAKPLQCRVQSQGSARSA